MAEYNVIPKVKKGNEYITFYPKTKGSIVDFNKNGSDLTSTNIDGAIKESNNKIGSLTSLLTKAKNNVVSAINELFSLANNKQDKITGGASSVLNSNLTPNTVLVSDASGKISNSNGVTVTDLSHLKGAKRNIQEQIEELKIKTKDKVVICGDIVVTPKPNEHSKAIINFYTPFTEPPVVVLTPVTSVPGDIFKGCGVNNVTTTQAEVYVNRSNNTKTTIMWIAMGRV